MNIHALKEQGRALVAQQKALVDDTSRPWSAKQTDYERIDRDIKAILDQVDRYSALDARGLDQLASLHDDPSALAATGMGRLIASLGKSVIAAPALHLAAEQVAELHEAAVNAKTLSVPVEGKAALDEGGAPMGAAPTFRLPPTPLRREPQRVLNLIPTFAADSPVITYYQEAAAANAATAVAEGAQKPEATASYSAVSVSATKIATYKAVTDEALNDYPAFAQILQTRLTLDVIDAENAELLSATKTGAHNFAGLLNTTGILTRAKATEPNNIDLLSEAFDDLRLGASYTEPDGIVMHPTDWGNLRRAKDGNGRYYLAPQPSNAAALDLWGVPVVLTSQITAGTALVGSFAEACAVGVRDGLRVEIGLDGNDFTYNRRTIRAEERLALLVPRPTALVKVTGL